MVRFYAAFFVFIVWQPMSALAQPTVLAELFCNEKCTNCPEQDVPYDSYLDTVPAVIPIVYHNANADPQDFFYTASTPASSDRDNFYSNGAGVNDPTAYIDGIWANTSFSSWESYCNESLGRLPKIASTVSFGPNSIDTIRFSVSGSSPIQVNFYVAIKESQIYFVNPSGNGEGNPPGYLWNDIFRAMLPTPTGSGSFLFNGNLDTFVIYDPSKFPKYFGNSQNTMAVLFVQDANKVPGDPNNSHQVEALGAISLAQPSGVAETASPSSYLIITSNPMPQGGHLGFELASACDVRLTLCDMLGREVQTLVDGEMPAGQTTVEMNSVALSAGCYFARLIVNGIIADNEKFIVAP